MNLLTIFVFVLIIILIYVVYKLMTKTTVSVSGFSDASKAVTLSCSKFGTTSSSNYGYSLWLYIDAWSTTGQLRTNKNVITRYSTASAPLFQMYLDNIQNNLNLVINGTSATTNNSPCTIRNVQLQKWINITMSVYGNTVDLYLDGKLVRTCIMAYPPAPLSSSDSLYIGGGYNADLLPKDGDMQGYITSVVYKANYFTPEEAWSIYSAGYSGSGMFDFLSKYKLNVSLTNNNQVLGAVSV